ncbi:MAG: NUDIX domain-containing protein [Thermoanaerobaculia bacterium]
MSEPRLLDRRTVYEGRVLKVGIDRVELPDGGTTELEVIRHSGASVVAPVTDDGEILLVRQYRYATGQWLFEAPAGKLAAGETPESCARRELEEETGWRAAELVPLGSVWSSPGFTDELLHLFLARGLETGTQALEEAELLTVERAPLDEVVAMARDGRIADAKTVCVLLRAAAVLGR